MLLSFLFTWTVFFSNSSPHQVLVFTHVAPLLWALQSLRLLPPVSFENSDKPGSCSISHQDSTGHLHKCKKLETTSGLAENTAQFADLFFLLFFIFIIVILLFCLLRLGQFGRSSHWEALVNRSIVRNVPFSWRWRRSLPTQIGWKAGKMSVILLPSWCQVILVFGWWWNMGMSNKVYLNQKLRETFIFKQFRGNGWKTETKIEQGEMGEFHVHMKFPPPVDLQRSSTSKLWNNSGLIRLITFKLFFIIVLIVSKWSDLLIWSICICLYLFVIMYQLYSFLFNVHVDSNLSDLPTSVLRPCGWDGMPRPSRRRHWD